MKRITFLINSLAAGGAERVLSLLATKLYQKKISVTVICLERDDFYKLPAGIKLIYLSPKKNNNIFLKLINNIYIIFKLRSFIINRKISSIQSHLFKANYLNLLVKLIGAGHKAQIVNTVAVDSKYTKKTIKGRVNLFLIKYLYPYADLIIYKSTAMAVDFKSKYNFKNKQAVINNPYDFNIIKALSKKQCPENITVDKNTLVSVGRFETHKNYPFLLKTFSLLVRDNSELKLVIIGDGPEKTKIEKMVNTLGITEKVTLTGRITNPFCFLAKAGLYVSCSESEGFPNALIEALVCGIPAVSSDCLSGPREILAPGTDPHKRLESGYECGEYGILFAVHDADALKEAIHRLFSDKGLYSAYKMKTQEAVEKYSIDDIIKEYKAVLGITAYPN